MSSHANPVRLSLNTQALNRLLGGDTQLEIELRNQVVNEFTKKNLKGILESKAYQSTLTELSEQIEEYIKVNVGSTVESYNKNTYSYELRGTVTQRIKTIIESTINETVVERVKTLLEEAIPARVDFYKRSLIKQVDDAVKTLVAAKLDTFIDSNLSARVKTLMDDNIDILVKQEITRRLEAIK